MTSSNTSPKLNDVFGPDVPTTEACSRIAEQIRSVKASALTTAQQQDDVITLIEYMQAHVVTVFDLNTKRSADLDKREAELNALKRKLDTKARALDVAGAVKGWRRYFWR